MTGASPTLAELGPRICIMGPSNSGKSTLAAVIAAASGLEVVHLDRLRHLPHTDWVARPATDFVVVHDAAIRGEHWVIDGNYTRLLPQRLARATGLILLDVPTVTSLYRYVRRCLFERERIGGLDGGRDSVKWAMIHHVAVTTRRNRQRYRAMASGLDMPVVTLASARAVAAFCQANRLAPIGRG